MFIRGTQLMKWLLVLVLMFRTMTFAQNARLYIVNDSKGTGFALRPP
jgi:hypothetical protein